MKKHRARLRPKAIRRKKAVFVRSFAGAVLAAGATALFLSKPWEGRLPENFRFPLPEAARVERVDVFGAGEPLASTAKEALGFEPGDRWGLFETSRKRLALLDAFPALKDVRVTRSWLAKTVSVDLSLRLPVARVSVKGREAGYMDSEGVRFELPAKSASEADRLPVVDLDAVPEGGSLEELGGMLAAAGRPDALPSPLARFGWSGVADGWSGMLEDGTRVLWGDLERTEEKLRRLSEVMLDARGRFDAVVSADLRHFEDGKILVRPR